MLKKVLLIVGLVLGIAFPSAVFGASYTPNLRLKKPTKAETGFLDAHNSNMQVLDTKLNEALSAVPVSSLAYGTSILGEWIADPSITSDQADATTAKSLAKIISDLSGASVDVRLPAGTYNIWRSYTVPATIKLKPDNGVVLTPWKSIRETAYKWTASGSGTSEYYLEIAAGGAPGVYEPSSLRANALTLTAGTAGSLTASQWDWADNDSLGYSTVYVRLADSADPDGKTAGYVEAWYTLTIAGGFSASPQQVFDTKGTVVFSNGIDTYPEWWGVDGTDDYVQIQAAIDSITASRGLVRLLSKTYTLGATGVTIPLYVGMTGAGQIATTMYYSGTGYAVTLGSAAQLNYGCRVSDLRIILTDIAGKGVQLLSTVGAIVENIYIEGVIAASRTNIGVYVVSSTGYSNFFNQIRNVQCAHMQTGFQVASSTTMATCSHFVNCTTTGDVALYPANGSKGYNFDTNAGHGTLIDGGNIESCNIGIYFNTDGDSITAVGTRFEGNTVDIIFSLTSIGSTFVSLKGVDNVSDSSGTGFGQHTFVGCTKSDGKPLTNKLNETTFDNQTGTAIIPLKVRGYPGQTADLFQILNASSGELFIVAADGSVVAAGSLEIAVAEHADNAAAVTAGLPVNRVYRTGDALKIVH